jgi:hypothetical protein
LGCLSTGVFTSVGSSAWCRTRDNFAIDGVKPGKGARAGGRRPAHWLEGRTTRLRKRDCSGSPGGVAGGQASVDGVLQFLAELGVLALRLVERIFKRLFITTKGQNFGLELLVDGPEPRVFQWTHGSVKLVRYTHADMHLTVRSASLAGDRARSPSGSSRDAEASAERGGQLARDVSQSVVDKFEAVTQNTLLGGNGIYQQPMRTQSQMCLVGRCKLTRNGFRVLGGDLAASHFLSVTLLNRKGSYRISSEYMRLGCVEWVWRLTRYGSLGLNRVLGRFDVVGSGLD